MLERIRGLVLSESTKEIVSDADFLFSFNKLSILFHSLQASAKKQPCTTLYQ
jgi:hypothetical protein